MEEVREKISLLAVAAVPLMHSLAGNPQSRGEPDLKILPIKKFFPLAF
jgi:hypothetical protein